MRRSIVIGLGLLAATIVVVAALALRSGGSENTEREDRGSRQAPSAPTWKRPTILRVDNRSDTSSPWPPALFRPTNVFVQTTGNVDQMVYAGASGRNLEDGMIAEWEKNGRSGIDGQKLSTARGTGALRLTSFSRRTVWFTSESGRTGSYDLDRNRLRLDGKPGVRIDCVTAPCPSPRP
jgi:hypothetical protein